MESKILNRRLAAAFMVLLTAPLTCHAETVFWASQEKSSENRAKSVVASMSNEELVGQVLMLGYVGIEPTDQFLSWVRQWGIGGVKVFGWNTADLTRMAKGIIQMQKEATEENSGIPLFVATDQEGGWVRHVKGSTSITPGNMAIGASGIAFDAYSSGYIIGKELSVLGINMNFAPTVDVYTNPGAHVIGPRSFSSDPLETAFLSVAYYRGMEEAGVISTAKHFPGHGNTAADSHGTLPVIQDSLEKIWDVDLLPYRMLIKEGIPSIMSGHLNFPAITGDSEPATLSPVLLNGILRDKMRFEGLVITDDMMMFGARQGDRSIPEICEMALRAGNDMVMVSRPPDVQSNVRNYLLTQLYADPDFKAIVSSSVERIVETKLTYLKPHGKVALYPDIERIDSEIPNTGGKSFIFDLACRSTTLIKSGAIPIDTVESRGVLLVGDYDEFFAEGTAKYPDAGTLTIERYPLSAREIERIIAGAQEYQTVIVCLADEESLKTLQDLRPLASKIAVLSVLNPVYLAQVPWVTTAVAVYGTGFESFKAGFAALAGDFTPEGRLPISIPGG
jgi:beta-N-acetylhexosaminidase